MLFLLYFRFLCIVHSFIHCPDDHHHQQQQQYCGSICLLGSFQTDTGKLWINGIKIFYWLVHSVRSIICGIWFFLFIFSICLNLNWHLNLLFFFLSSICSLEGNCLEYQFHFIEWKQKTIIEWFLQTIVLAVWLLFNILNYNEI